MKFTRLSPHFALAVLFTLLVSSLGMQPAWGGGWETSGDRASSPSPTTRPAAVAMTCAMTVRITQDKTNEVYTMERSETLSPEQFKNGIVTFVSDEAEKASGAATEVRKLVAGQKFQLSLSENIQSLKKTTRLRVAARMASAIATTDTVNFDKDHFGARSEVSLQLKSRSIRLTVSCREASPALN